MYDTLGYKCFFCGKKNYAQTKILGNLTLHGFVMGDEFFLDKNEDLYNCILNLKNKCENCGKKSSIIIKNSKFMGVEDPKNSTIIERHFGDYEIVDELQQIVAEKLKQIKDGK